MSQLAICLKSILGFVSSIGPPRVRFCREIDTLDILRSQEKGQAGPFCGRKEESCFSIVFERHKPRVSRLSECIYCVQLIPLHH